MCIHDDCSEKVQGIFKDICFVKCKDFLKVFTFSFFDHATFPYNYRLSLKRPGEQLINTSPVQALLFSPSLSLMKAASCLWCDYVLKL